MTTSTLDGLRNEHPVKHHRRRSIRLPCFDYTQAGAYFVTICACERDRLFGDIVNGEMRLNPAGWGEDEYNQAVDNLMGGS